MNKTLVILAAGLATRYGGGKQLAPVGPNGEALLDYAIYDAMSAGIDRICFVIRPALEDEFREHVSNFFGSRLSVDYAYQTLDDIPNDFPVFTSRIKPWGTAHAVWVARHEVKTPFIVINADDFYGVDVYTQLARQLDNSLEGTGIEYTMAGYSLGETLSPFGGVSRGLCECDADGFLKSLVEVKNIRSEKGSLIGHDVSGTQYKLNTNDIVSMNIWGLTPAIFPILERQFVTFLSKYAQNLDAEFLLSTAINEQITEGDATLKVLHAKGRWMGMTFREDRAAAEKAIADLIDRSKYPKDLGSSIPTP